MRCQSFLCLNLSRSGIDQYKTRIAKHCLGLGRHLTHRLEYNRPDRSCDGEPAPSLALPIVPPVLSVFAPPKGFFTELPPGGSMGEVFDVDEPDLGCAADSCGM